METWVIWVLAILIGSLVVAGLFYLADKADKSYDSGEGFIVYIKWVLIIYIISAIAIVIVEGVKETSENHKESNNVEEKETDADTDVDPLIITALISQELNVSPNAIEVESISGVYVEVKDKNEDTVYLAKFTDDYTELISLHRLSTIEEE